MNIVNKLTVRHLRLNKSRTLITILGIMLSVAMVCAVAGFVMSLREVMREAIIGNRGDYHIAYIGVSEETAAAIAQEDVYSTSYTKSSQAPGMTDVFLRLETPGRDYREIAEAIGEKYNSDTYGVNTELLALDGAIAQDNIMQAFIIVAAIAIVIIVTGSVIVIANAFYISSAERVRQFGLLKSAGATKGQIGRSILFEAAVLAAIAIPLGIALGFLIQAVVLQLVNGLLTELNQLNTQDTTFRVIFSPVVIFISIGIALLTLLVSAWLPAHRAANISPIDAIRRAKDIKIRSKRLKTSCLTAKLFGFEGTLASKSLKRSRGKYRATVVSLTLSIVLFVSVSSLIQALNKGVQMEYGGYDFDVYMMSSEDFAAVDGMEQQLATIPDAEIGRYQFLSGAYAELPDGFLTKSAVDYFREVYGDVPPLQTSVRLISYPDSEFDKVTSLNHDELIGILINSSGTVSIDGRRVEYTPFNEMSGTTLALSVAGEVPDRPVNIRIVATLGKIPESIPPAMYDGESVNILLPESVFRKFSASEPESLNHRTVLTVKTADPDAFCESARKLLPDEGKISINNVAQMTQLNRNIVLIIMLFGYGFIAMLSLIAVTSVITTISTGMALRRQEFAMLHSAGMTPEGMNKMLNLESLLYGLKAIAIGLPTGLALSYLIFTSVSGVLEFAYVPPYSAMAISAAAVMLLTFGTMRYSKNKMKKVSIVEALRSETA